MTRDEIVAQARTWLNAPYRHQGRSKTDGVDCMGFIIGVAEELGYTTIEAPNRYSTAPNGTELLAGCERNLKKMDRDLDAIRKGDLRSLVAGDILVFWGFTRGEAQHFAFVGDSTGGRARVARAPTASSSATIGSASRPATTSTPPWRKSATGRTRR